MTKMIREKSWKQISKFSSLGLTCLRQSWAFHWETLVQSWCKETSFWQSEGQITGCHVVYCKSSNAQRTTSTNIEKENNRMILYCLARILYVKHPNNGWRHLESYFDRHKKQTLCSSNNWFNNFRKVCWINARFHYCNPTSLVCSNGK